MGKTIRNTKYAKWFRKPKTKQVLAKEHAYKVDAPDLGISIRNRELTRGNVKTASIPTSWDDQHISALEENKNKGKMNKQDWNNRKRKKRDESIC